MNNYLANPRRSRLDPTPISTGSGSGGSVVSQPGMTPQSFVMSTNFPSPQSGSKVENVIPMASPSLMQFQKKTLAAVTFSLANPCVATFPSQGDLTGWSASSPPIGFDSAGSSLAITNSGRTITFSSSGFRSAKAGTHAMTTGKWYWEVKQTTATNNNMSGICNELASPTGSYSGADANGMSYFGVNGTKISSGGQSAFGSSWSAANDIIGIAFDADNRKIYFSKNGVWQNSGNPAAGTGFAYDGTTITAGHTWYPTHTLYNSGESATANWAATDLVYTPPAGFSSFGTTITLPVGTHAASVIVTKNRVYLLGGGAPDSVSDVYTSVIDSNGALGSFTTGTNLPTAVRGSFAFITLNRVYLCGGYTTGPSGGVWTAPINSDGTLGTWTTSADLPGAMYYHGGVITTNRVYLIGGGGSSPVYTAPINTDGTLGTWTTGPTLPEALYPAVAKIGDKVHLLGLGSTATYTSTIASDGTLGAWTSGAAMPSTGTMSSVAVVRNKVYVLGGTANQLCTAPINTDGTLGSWSTSTLTGTLQYSSILVTSSKIYMLGGYNGSYANTIYSAAFLGGSNDYITVPTFGRPWAQQYTSNTSQSDDTNGFLNGQMVRYSTTGTLYTGLIAEKVYYVINKSGNTFQMSASLGGTAIATTGTQSGVHSLYWKVA